MNLKDIKWRTYKGEAGDLETMLVGEYNGITFSHSYQDTSFFNLSFWYTKRQIVKTIKLLHANHWVN
jgi:hypothetical protein